MSEVYTYCHLLSQHIRILLLHPSGVREDDPIHCELKHLRLPVANGSADPVFEPEDAQPIDEHSASLPLEWGEDDYEALSYSWGDGPEQHEIICDRRVLKVRSNLYHALQQLRLRTRTRRLWVDAICINQEDLQEKSEQVAIMTTIFRGALHGVVWLGEDSAPSEMRRCFNFFEQVAAVIPYHNYYQRNNTLKEVDNIALDVLGSKPVRSKGGVFFEGGCPRILSDFFSRSWFRRRWIVRELFSNPRAVVLCGQQSIGWGTMAKATARFFDLDPRWFDHSNVSNTISKSVRDSLGPATHLIRPPKLQASMNVMNKGSPFYESNVEERSLIPYLEAFADFECRDDRDRVFGLLSLGSSTFEPNYRLSVEEVYKRFAAHTVTTPHGATHWLLQSAAVRLRFSTTSSLPSWVPDWRRYASPGHRALRSGLSERGGGTVTIDGQRLHLTARIVEVIHREFFPEDPEGEILTDNDTDRGYKTFLGNMVIITASKDQHDNPYYPMDYLQCGDLYIDCHPQVKFLVRPIPYVDESSAVKRLPQVKLVGMTHHWYSKDPRVGLEQITCPEDLRQVFVKSALMDPDTAEDPIVRGKEDLEDWRRRPPIKLVGGLPVGVGYLDSRLKTYIVIV